MCWRIRLLHGTVPIQISGQTECGHFVFLSDDNMAVWLSGSDVAGCHAIKTYCPVAGFPNESSVSYNVSETPVTTAVNGLYSYQLSLNVAWSLLLTNRQVMK